MDHAKTGRIDGGRPTVGTRLSFAGDLEQEYRAEHLRRVRQRARLWQAAEVLVAPTVAFLYDGTRGADGWRVEVLVCLWIGFLLSLALVALVWLRYDARRYLPVAAWLTPLRSMAYAVVIAHMVDIGGLGTAVLTASTFGHFFFAGLLFHQAAVSALGMFVAYAGALIFYEVPSGVTGYALATVAAVQTMAAVVAHDAQRASRIAFLEHGAVRSRAEHDALTGLRNRRDFDERFAAYWNQSKSSEEPLTVLMIDVDHFKAYNDRHGHQAGDDVLRQVAMAVRAAARGGDVVARYGGEEFVMLATGLDEPGAAALGERIRASVEQLAIPHEASSCANVITVSVGVAHVMPQAGRSPEGALQLADENLYRAKREGRNAFVMHGADYELLRTGRFRHEA